MISETSGRSGCPLTGIRHVVMRHLLLGTMNTRPEAVADMVLASAINPDARIGTQ